MGSTVSTVQALLVLILVPPVMASPQTTPFPGILFKDFSDFINSNFGPKISLPTVLVLLLSMTNNTELLSLHFKQDMKGGATSWIRCLARALTAQLGPELTETLFLESQVSAFKAETIQNPEIVPLAKKLSKFSHILGLYPYNQKQKFTGTLKSISHDSIHPALLICPNSSACLTLGCGLSFLKQNSRPQDITNVTLIKGTDIYSKVQLLSGHCNKCKTIYYADHERTAPAERTEAMKFFINSAKYLKVGQKIWVDRGFSAAVLNGIYNLHASASGWTNFFNDTYGKEQIKLSRRHIWAAFVQESIRCVSETSQIDFSIRDKASILDVTQMAFAELGQSGIIHPAKDHECAECSQPYQATSDVISNPSDPSPLPGVNSSSEAMTVDSGSGNPELSNSNTIIKMKNTTLKVIDGLVNGTKVFKLKTKYIQYSNTDI